MYSRTATSSNFFIFCMLVLYMYFNLAMARLCTDLSLEGGAY